MEMTDALCMWFVLPDHMSFCFFFLEHFPLQSPTAGGFKTTHEHHTEVMT